MPEVTIEIAGRSYRVGCGAGEEDHLRALALRLDTEAQKLSRGASTIPEARLLLMTALVIADRLWECQKEIRALEKRLETTATPSAESGDSDAPDAAHAREAALIAEIEGLAARLEAIAPG
ncbi:MAG: cell division protein ZapA [Pseudomonadota bacterium]